MKGNLLKAYVRHQETLLGYSNKDVAMLVGLSPSSLSTYLSKGIDRFSVKQFNRLCKGLKFSPEMILEVLNEQA